jgi:Fe-Mn family superoxide dismutase
MNSSKPDQAVQTPDYSRRRFLALGTAAIAVSALGAAGRLRAAEPVAGLADAMPKAEGVFTIAPLPYGYDALAPSIDEETMHLHHDKHYAAYAKKLNDALAQAPELKSKSIEQLLANTSSLPKAVRKAIRNNGGGYYNHSLFWRWMTPNGAGKPDGDLAAAIDASFGSFDAFKTEFSKEAGDIFGSGWAWLILNHDGKLEITTTPNQDSPIMDVAETKGKPILGLDVWEHAYYLKYKNVRADYIKSWWQLVNWKTASELYAAAKA